MIPNELREQWEREAEKWPEESYFAYLAGCKAEYNRTKNAIHDLILNKSHCFSSGPYVHVHDLNILTGEPKNQQHDKE